MPYLGNTPSNQAYAPLVEYFSGNAVATVFTLARPVATPSQIFVVVNNVPQNPYDAFTVSGNTLTFTSAPSTGTNNIWVEYTSLITTQIAPGQGTVTISSLSATGTANGSTFLSGNNTWQTINTTPAAVSDQNNTSTGYFSMPSGTTAQRPVSPANGSMRYNTTIGDVELYVNGAWVAANYTAAPTVSSAPVISGAAQINATLSCTTGTWNNTPTGYYYQWLANSTAITNATANTITLSMSQVGANITCNVTAYNIAGNSTPSTSNSIGPILNVVLAQYVVVAGGGGGYGYHGGGAGGMLSNTVTLSPGTQYTITVGSGGAAGDSNGTSSNITGSGFTTITTVGGGSGNNRNGGSGGGSGTGTAGQGNNGGGSGGSAGGGGAGAAGTAGDGSSVAGNGGAGAVNPIAGSTSGQSSGGSYYLAGGGAGGRTNWDGGSGGSAGLGGGGAFTYFTNTGENAPANMGGGGGPSGPNGGHGGSGSGGSGIVILSVPTSGFSNTYTGSNTVVTTSGANTIVTFNASGTYTA